MCKGIKIVNVRDLRDLDQSCLDQFFLYYLRIRSIREWKKHRYDSHVLVYRMLLWFLFLFECIKSKKKICIVKQQGTDYEWIFLLLAKNTVLKVELGQKYVSVGDCLSFFVGWKVPSLFSTEVM